MVTSRTVTGGVAIATALLTISGPAVAVGPTVPTAAVEAAVAPIIPISRGTAATTSVPLHIEAGGLPVDLGATVLTATTDEDVTELAPWSAVGLTLANVGGARFGDLAVRSDGSTNSPGSSVARSTAVGDVTVTTGNLLALADAVAGSATAAVTTLTTEATVLEGVGLTVTVTDVVASVDDTGAAATHSLTVGRIGLDLSSVLEGVLDTLPLQDLIAIADILGVTVPANLDAADGVVTATEDLLTAVAAAATATTGVDTAATALTDAEALDPLADFGDIAALEALLATVQGLDPIGDPVGALADITAVLADDDFTALGCVTAVPAVDLLAAISDAETCLTDQLAAYQAALDALADELAALQTAVDEYLAAVADAAAAAAVLDGDAATLADIVTDITTLLGDLLDAPLLVTEPIDITQQVRAVGGSLDASSASHTCQLTTLTALDGTPVDISDCDAASAAVTDAVALITGTLGSVLDTVGGVDAGDGVALELFGTVEDAVSEDTDGVVRATSVMEVLALTVPEITITPCDVEVRVCALGVDLDGQLTDAVTAVDGVLSTAQTTATGAVDTLTATLAALDTGLDLSAADAADATVDAALAALQGVLDGLDLGKLGEGGVTVPGVNVVVDPSLEAEHGVTAASTTPPAPAPADPAPEDPTDGPDLPNTGGGAALVAVVAIGAGAWLYRRRDADLD